MSMPPDHATRIMHVDMDAFFASVEQAVNPHLQGRPVLVGGEARGRGVVAAASYESRAFGVHSAMNTAEARRRCPEAVLVEVDGDHYGYVSRRIREIFGRYSPKVEMLSVDEAFLDVTGCAHLHQGEANLADRLKRAIRDSEGLTCSVGIAPNRSLAKIVSSVYKPDGLMVIGPEDIPQVIFPLPVSRFSGIGPVAERGLAELGIRTLGELASAEPDRLRRVFGDRAERLQNILHGGLGSPVLAPEDQPDEKSMGHEVTLSADTRDQVGLEAMLMTLTDRVARRLRDRGFVGRTVTVRVRRHDFETHTHRATLPAPTDRAAEVFACARRLFRKAMADPRPVRLIGVSVSNLTPADNHRVQGDLFGSHIERERGAKLEKVWDSLRDRYGESVMTRAVSRLRSR